MRNTRGFFMALSKWFQGDLKKWIIAMNGCNHNHRENDVHPIDCDDEVHSPNGFSMDFGTNLLSVF